MDKTMVLILVHFVIDRRGVAPCHFEEHPRDSVLRLLGILLMHFANAEDDPAGADTSATAFRLLRGFLCLYQEDDDIRLHTKHVLDHLRQRSGRKIDKWADDSTARAPPASRPGDVPIGRVFNQMFLTLGANGLVYVDNEAGRGLFRRMAVEGHCVAAITSSRAPGPGEEARGPVRARVAVTPLRGDLPSSLADTAGLVASLRKTQVFEFDLGDATAYKCLGFYLCNYAEAGLCRGNVRLCYSWSHIFDLPVDPLDYHAHGGLIELALPPGSELGGKKARSGAEHEVSGPLSGRRGLADLVRICPGFEGGWIAGLRSAGRGPDLFEHAAILVELFLYYEHMGCLFERDREVAVRMLAGVTAAQVATEAAARRAASTQELAAPEAEAEEDAELAGASLSITQDVVQAAVQAAFQAALRDPAGRAGGGCSDSGSDSDSEWDLGGDLGWDTIDRGPDWASDSEWEDARAAAGDGAAVAPSPSTLELLAAGLPVDETAKLLGKKAASEAARVTTKLAANSAVRMAGRMATKMTAKMATKMANKMLDGKLDEKSVREALHTTASLAGQLAGEESGAEASRQAAKMSARLATNMAASMAVKMADGLTIGTVFKVTVGVTTGIGARDLATTFSRLAVESLLESVNQLGREAARLEAGPADPPEVQRPPPAAVVLPQQPVLGK
ncbi:hypothetical protein, variant [Fonticula alba]|nr:hypothetical protein, variant [Fonticula alba]KCV71927.1 hypothetical protein, variant [Fonticula alba]|eukprot:XP_009493504.1 hypothetical protein, variant [Fonticula alba]